MQQEAYTIPRECKIIKSFVMCIRKHINNWLGTAIPTIFCNWETSWITTLVFNVCKYLCSKAVVYHW